MMGEDTSASMSRKKKENKMYGMKVFFEKTTKDGES
jgi:hypothetical protein